MCVCFCMPQNMNATRAAHKCCILFSAHAYAATTATTAATTMRPKPAASALACLFICLFVCSFIYLFIHLLHWFIRMPCGFRAGRATFSLFAAQLCMCQCSSELWPVTFVAAAVQININNKPAPPAVTCPNWSPVSVSASAFGWQASSAKKRVNHAIIIQRRQLNALYNF